MKGIQTPLISRFHLKGVFVSSSADWNDYGSKEWVAMMESLTSSSAPHQHVIGVDTEWFCKSPTAVVQIASFTHCFVFHVSYMDNRALPDCVKELLEHEQYLKCGVGINGDVKQLRQHLQCALAPTMNVEDFAQLLFAVGPGNYGLKKLTELLVEEEMPFKTDKLTRSNWELPLSVEQCQYAADDAVASYAVGRRIVEAAIEKKLLPVEGTDGLRVSEWAARTQPDAARSRKSTLKAKQKEQQKKVPKQHGNENQSGFRVEVFDTNGLFIFHCSQHRAKYYTEDQHVTNVLDYYPGTSKPSKIQLLFEPKRKSRLCVYHIWQLPCSETCSFAHGVEELLPESAELLHTLTPSCAMCLATQGLFRFSVLPPPIRKYLPAALRVPQDSEFFPLCRQCQSPVTEKATRHMRQMFKEAQKSSSIDLGMVKRCCALARVVAGKSDAAVQPSVTNEMSSILSHLDDLHCLLGELTTDTADPVMIFHHLASFRPDEVVTKVSMFILLGDDVEKGRAFIKEWWNFFYDKCGIQRKDSNFLTAQQWSDMMEARKQRNRELKAKDGHGSDEPPQ